MKRKQKGVSTAAMTIAVVVVAVVVVAGAAVFLLGGPTAHPTGGIAFNATATVRLHDAYTMNVADWAENHMPDITGVTVSVTGSVTINSSSAANVTVKLHNKTAEQWITIVEGQTITDMTVPTYLANQISSGTYDKVKVYLGTVTVNMSWTDITVAVHVDLTQIPEITPEALAYMQSMGMPTEIDNTFTAQALGSYSGTVTVNQEFELSLSPEITVTEGENQVFDVDTGSPFDFDISSSLAADYNYTFSPDFDAGQMEQGNMEAHGEEGGAGPE